MVERGQIQTGAMLQVLRRLGCVAPGTVGRVSMIRAEQRGIPWAFTTFWPLSVKKQRCRYFTEADLAMFEILATGQPAAVEAVRGERIAPHQLSLPFTEWCLYR